MENQIATSIAQSQRLIACGVDPKTADMYWNEGLSKARLHVLFDEWDEQLRNLNCSPAWSTACLLSLLPASLISANGSEYMLELSKLRMYDAWEVKWYNGRNRWTTRGKSVRFSRLWGKSPIEAIVKAIEWLTKEGKDADEIKQIAKANKPKRRKRTTKKPQ